MKYYKSIECDCGNEIDLDDILDNVRDQALNTGESSDLEDEIICDDCSAIYKVDASAYIDVEVSITSIELVSQGVDVDGEMISINQFGIGDNIDLQDGEYQAGNMVFGVSNGVVATIYNAEVDEDQLALAI